MTISSRAKKKARPQGCTWKRVDAGTMGFIDIEWHTTCGKKLGCDRSPKTKYCGYCGGEVCDK